jgi:hypothetical protein
VNEYGVLRTAGSPHPSPMGALPADAARLRRSRTAVGGGGGGFGARSGGQPMTGPRRGREGGGRRDPVGARPHAAPPRLSVPSPRDAPRGVLALAPRGDVGSPTANGGSAGSHLAVLPLLPCTSTPPPQRPGTRVDSSSTTPSPHHGPRCGAGILRGGCGAREPPQ